MLCADCLSQTSVIMAPARRLAGATSPFDVHGYRGSGEKVSIITIKGRKTVPFAFVVEKVI